jgi:DNA primase
MARIPQEDIERLKQQVDLVALVRSYGVELKGQGDNLMGLCPLHDDHKPSLVVSPEKQLWNCLGACGAGGDVFEWVKRPSQASATPARSSRAVRQRSAEKSRFFHTGWNAGRPLGR